MSAGEKEPDHRAQDQKTKSKTGIGVASLKDQRADLEKQKAVLDSLIEGQTGPVKIDELSRILRVTEDPKMNSTCDPRLNPWIRSVCGLMFSWRMNVRFVLGHAEQRRSGRIPPSTGSADTL